MTCLICGEELDPVNAYQGTHPGCEPLDSDPLGDQLRETLTNIIKWADDNSERSLQAAIGPSEISTPCDRRLAYRLAEIPEVNTHRDPWPAIVGTAVHMWLEQAITKTGNAAFETEVELEIDPGMPGHSDLFFEGMVVDYKTAGTEVMREVRKFGQSRKNKVQTQLYGRGQVNAGKRVTHVALVTLPRGGNLSAMHVWTDRFRPEVAQAALDRMYSIKLGLSNVDIWNNPQVFDLIPAMKDKCGYCPYYRKDGLMNIGIADESGCPGAQ